MRTLILVILSLALLLGGFLLYRSAQAPIPTAGGIGVRPDLPTRTAATQDVRYGDIGAGQGVWATRYDRDTGKALVRFRAAEYQPQPDGRIRVTRPQADFFIGPRRDKICRIEGATGWVTVHGEAPRLGGDLKSMGPVQAPTRGDLLGVRIRYYNSQQDLDAGNHDLMLDLEHMSFDIETYRIASEAYVDSQGRRIEAEDVPVQVRGRSFDFDGRGLQLRWDEYDQKLEMLRVLHGGRLLIKQPGNLDLPGKELLPTTGQAQASLEGAQVLPRPFDPVRDGGLLAAATRRPSAARPPAPRARSTGDIYRATFHNDVKVTQEDQQLARTPLMHVDFLSPNSQHAQPATATAAAAPAAPGASAASGAGRGDAAAARSATHPAGATRRSTQPATTAESQPPVLITWNGEFTVYPISGQLPQPTTSNDAVVRLVGPGTTITASGGRVDCEEALYHAEPRTAAIRGGARQPAKLVDARGATIVSPLIEYSMTGGWAVLTGQSSAVIPTQQAGKAETLSASWSRACTLFLTTGPRAVVKGAELSGDVSVQHPQVPQFKAQKLVLKFDPTAKPADKAARAPGADRAAGAAATGGFDASSANLRTLEAEGGVDAVIADAGGATRSIRCEKLKLDTENGADGKLYPTRLEAHGKVIAGDRKQDQQQELRAENVVASLVPQLGGQKDVQWAGLRDLAADGDVSMSSADGGKLQAEKVHVTGGEEGKPRLLRLEGKPGQLAMLARGERAIWGPLIEADVARQQASVQGAGAMRLSNPTDPGKPAMPLEVTWNKAATVDGQKNEALVDGKVVVTFQASDGSTNNAWGERVQLALAPVPGAKPREGEVTFLADRFVKHMELQPVAGGEVQIQSLLPAADGSLIRQMNLLGPTLICELSQQGLEQLTVPAGKEKPGRLLYLDLTPANRQPTAVKPSLESRGLHGATAFAWRDKLVYDRAKSLVEMTGNVLIRHEPMDRSAESFEVSGDKVSAILAEQRDVAGRVPAAPKAHPDAQTPTVALKRITIVGQPLSFTREDLQFTAPRIDFEPITHLAFGRADSRFPVRVEKGVSRGDFGEVEFNTETQMVKLRDAGLTGRK